MYHAAKFEGKLPETGEELFDYYCLIGRKVFDMIDSDQDVVKGLFLLMYIHVYAYTSVQLQCEMPKLVEIPAKTKLLFKINRLARTYFLVFKEDMLMMYVVLIHGNTGCIFA